MTGLMEWIDGNIGSKVLVDKKLRDEIVEITNEHIELNIKERNVVKGVLDVINKRFKNAIEVLKGRKKTYKLDKKASKKNLKAKIKAEKEVFKKAKNEAKKQYKEGLKEFYKPVIEAKNNINSIKGERNEQIEMLQEIKKEITDLQKYKAYIDMKYTSDNDEYIEQNLLPKVLRKK